jgi:SAM-dependent methyltransferase
MDDQRAVATQLTRLDAQAGSGLAPDPYLAGVAARHPTHAFLGGNTQLIYQRQVRFLVALVKLRLNRVPSDLRVLDWGCGKGHISYLLRGAGFQVTACDVNARTDDSAFGQATPIITEQAIDVVPLLDKVALPFADASFDVVLSVGVLEHVEDDAGSLRELRRVLKPDGLCLVSFLPYTLSWTQRLAHARGDRYHSHLYSRAGVARLAAGAGFRVLCMAHGQLFPKNSVSLRAASLLEPLDRALCRHTPLRFLATNLEVVLAPV